MLNSINWPEKYLPGTTDNFASNEVIVKGLTVADVWPYLSHIQAWDKYYENCSDAKYAVPGTTELSEGTKFSFNTFGFLVEADVTEFEAPKDGVARIAWHGLSNAGQPDELNVVHAWLLENLPGDRVRILTQESQIGTPAAAMAGTNTMIDGHQSWLNGIVKAAKEKIAY